jgi:prepilin-type N-terminal cleavage/methylation domain-containing protein
MFREGRLPRRGFTLVEVMVAAVILSLGMVVVFESFLKGLDTFNFFNNRLNAQWFINEKIWQVQAALDQPIGAFLPAQETGTVMVGNKEFTWQVSLSVLDVQQELYQMDAQMLWREGNKQRVIKRCTAIKRYFINADI